MSVNQTATTEYKKQESKHTIVKNQWCKQNVSKPNTAYSVGELINRLITQGITHVLNCLELYILSNTITSATCAYLNINFK